jgi:hypothetical protein
LAVFAGRQGRAGPEGRALVSCVAQQGPPALGFARILVLACVRKVWMSSTTDRVVQLREDGARSASSLAHQFATLGGLQPGWFELGTPVLDAQGLNAARSFLNETTALGLPVPHVYPTPEGGVRAEWTVGAWEVSVTFGSSGDDARLQATHVNRGAEQVSVIRISEGARSLVEFFSTLS